VFTSLKNSHAIEVPIGHPDEIDEIFDDISYHKGAAVIRMLHNYIGDDVSIFKISIEACEFNTCLHCHCPGLPSRHEVVPDTP